MAIFSIAGLQLGLQRGNNQDLISREVRSAARRYPWLDMVVLPELSCFGPSIDLAEPAGGPAEQQFAALAAECGVWLVNGSLYERTAEGIFNTATVFAPDGSVVVRHRKLYPFHPYEKGVTAGQHPVVFDVPGVGRMGLAICYDIWFPEVARSLAWHGAEVLINTVLTNTIDREVETAMVRATAAQQQMYVVSINGAGDLAVGQSCIAGPGGEVIHQAGQGREVIVVEVDLDHVRHCRSRGWHGLGQVLKSFRDGPRHFDAYAGGPAPSPFLPSLGPLELPPPRPRPR